MELNVTFIGTEQERVQFNKFKDFISDYTMLYTTWINNNTYEVSAIDYQYMDNEELCNALNEVKSHIETFTSANCQIVGTD